MAAIRRRLAPCCFDLLLFARKLPAPGAADPECQELPLADAETPASLTNSAAIYGTFGDVGRYLLPVILNRQDVMDAKDRKVAESAFNKNERREAEITSALRQEQAKHEAAVKNMHRLRLLRLQRDAQKAASEAVSE